MADYISREAVTTLFARACGECKEACEEFDGFYADCNQCLLHGVLKEFAAIPAADVRPVVRCGECKHYEPLDMFRNRTDWNGVCHYWKCHATREDGFCFKAAKREGS